jgi:hypothetical protein
VQRKRLPGVKQPASPARAPDLQSRGGWMTVPARVLLRLGQDVE